MDRLNALLLVAVGCTALACGPSPEAVAPPQPAAAAATAAAAPAASSAVPVVVANKPADPAPPHPVSAAAAPPDATILTGISQGDILAAVNKNGDVFNRCYTLGAGGSKSYRAKITVKASVGPTGVVNAVEVVTSTAKNAKVDACVSEGFKKLTFTRPAGSGATVFTFPLSFDGLEQVQ